MEERVARLETNVEHIQSDVSDIKSDLRRLDAKVDEVRNSVVALKIETQESFAALRVGRVVDKIWWLLIAAALLSVMARGFKWL